MKKGKLAICMALLSCLAGCAVNMNKVPVSIYDSNVETIIDVREGTTVGNVLKKAEIVLNDGDTISPSLDTTVTETEMDIFIKRSEANQKNSVETDRTATDSTDANTEDEETTLRHKKQIATETEAPENKEPVIVSKEKIYDCDGSGHGYYLIKWSDGREEYEDF